MPCDPINVFRDVPGTHNTNLDSSTTPSRPFFFFSSSPPTPPDLHWPGRDVWSIWLFILQLTMVHSLVGVANSSKASLAMLEKHQPRITVPLLLTLVFASGKPFSRAISAVSDR